MFVVEDFNTPLSVNVGKIGITKDLKIFNNTNNKLNPFDICRILHPLTVE